MATPIFTRIPWRTVSRLGASAKPVFSNAFKTPQCAVAPFTSQSVRYSSNTPDVTEPASAGAASITPPTAEPATEEPSDEDIFNVRYPVTFKQSTSSLSAAKPNMDIRNLEFFSDFALRAAYYLKLPAYGPVPLPRMIERWTVPRSHFVHKKSQENFERKTLRRLIQIKDGHPETVSLWLAFLRKHAYYGIGMKANVWEYNQIGVGKAMDASMEEMKEVMKPQWELFGRGQSTETADKVMEILNRESFKAAAGGSAPGFLPPESCIQTTPKHPTLSVKSNIFWYPAHWNTASRELSWGITKLGAATRYSGIEYEAILLDCRLSCDYDTAEKGRAEAVEEGEFGDALGYWIGSGEEHGVLSEFCRCCIVFVWCCGSDEVVEGEGVAAHTELMWILSCTASMGYLSRMTQWKSKLSLEDDASPLDGDKKSKLKLGLFSYPVLQAADILVHRATHVPVGEDQTQHLEFARECVTNFNHAYGPRLIAPQTLLSPTKRIMSLQSPTQKMSKSHPSPISRILLADSPDTITKKISSALTDSQNAVSYSPSERPGVSNLLTLWSSFDTQNPKRTPAQIAEECKAKKFTLGDLKRETANAVNTGLEPIRKNYERLLGMKGMWRM
ncbi:tryptophanyl-tRNA synthetase [Botrytis cinerea]